MSNGKEYRFTSLEGLRAYMAWWVVITHAISLSGSGNLFPHKLAILLTSGARGVNEFIIVSGFVITHLLLTRQESYSLYLGRRFFRIFPIYIVCLVLAILLTPVQVALHDTSWAENPGLWQARFDAEQQHFFAHLSLHLTMLHGLLPDTVFPFSSSTFLGPAWSLSLEWQFYVLAPVIVALLTRGWLVRIATTLVALILVYVAREGYLGEWRFPSMLLLALHFFLIGILSRIFLERLLASPVWALAITGFIAGLVLKPINLELWIWTFFLVAMRFEVRPHAGRAARVVSWVAANPVAVALGKASYSTYLVHALLMAVCIAVLQLWLGELTRGVAQAGILLALVLLIPLSLTLYRLIEKPFVRIGSRLGLPARALGFP